MLLHDILLLQQTTDDPTLASSSRIQRSFSARSWTRLTNEKEKKTTVSDRPMAGLVGICVYTYKLNETKTHQESKLLASNEALIGTWWNISIYMNDRKHILYTRTCQFHRACVQVSRRRRGGNAGQELLRSFPSHRSGCADPLQGNNHPPHSYLWPIDLLFLFPYLLLPTIITQQLSLDTCSTTEYIQYIRKRNQTLGTPVHQYSALYVCTVPWH